MENITFAQFLVALFLSSSFMGGVFTIVTKKLWSPESKNELAKLGNEFAQQLLRDAKIEREELRLTIRELQDSISAKSQAIERLESLAKEKDKVIAELEERQYRMVNKLKEGIPITLKDIFGDKAPVDIQLITDEVV